MIRWKLNEVMARKRIRNKDLADALDITENSVYRLRKTDEMPRLTPERLNGICAALKCQPGDLLEWAPEGSELLERIAKPESAPELVETLTIQPVSRQVLSNLSRFYNQIVALSREGYSIYGPGAVVYTEKITGPEIAYIERHRLSDPNCHRAIDSSQPGISVVVIYYPTENYDTNNYIIFTLTGPNSPPDFFAPALN